MERLELVQMHIDMMTNDEDHKQELWLNYLEGKPLSSLEKILEQIKNDEKRFEQLKEVIWSIINNPPSKNLPKLLERFTPFEQQVMLMLALGCDISQISEYNGVSKVRLCQLLGNIRLSKEWESLYGPKEELERGRKLRFDT